MTEDRKAMLSGLSAIAVAAWLKQLGYSPVSNLGENGAILSRLKTDGEDSEPTRQELLLPTSPGASDFVRRMDALVSDLSNFEQRSEHDILSDLTLAPFDVIKVRSPDADDYGSLRLGAGLEIHEQAKQMVVAAANSAASPIARRSWRGRRFEEVDQYIASLRLGQSQRGSFVLNILSRWDFSPDGQSSLDFGETNFGRQVTQRLAKALGAVRRSLRLAVVQGAETFQNSYESGVSANLCLALSRLAREGDGIDISINWSASKVEDEGSRITLRRDDSSLLNEAARILAAEEDEPDFLMEGLVARISEPPEEFSGAAIVEGFVGNTLRKVRVNFDEGSRTTIYDAAREKKWVRLSGDLSRANNRLSLKRPRLIEILDSDDLAED